jgi:hypothetical protein
MYVRVLALPMLIALVSAAAPAHARPAYPISVVAAVNGNIVQYAADGSSRRQITSTGRDTAPVVAPGGGLAAFIRLSQPVHGLNSRHGLDLTAATPHNVMLLTLSPNREIFDVLTRVATATAPASRFTIAFGRCGCAPELYFWNGNTLEWRRLTGNQTPALKNNGPVNPGMNVPIAVGPVDRVIAVPIPPASTMPKSLPAQIAGRGRITITFPPGSLGASNDFPPGSYPTGAGMTVAPDGHHLVFATLFRGEGYFISGVWEAPVTGGPATRILGTASEARGRLPFAAALTGATQFQYSPNHRFLATDPHSALWVRSATSGAAHIISLHVARSSLHVARSCVLAQWTWLADSSGFAYVTACTTPSGGSMTLATVARDGGSRHTLQTVHTVRPYGYGAAIDLAPATRCVACGG